ncbi:MAG: integral rane sensor signal transduction histidine kinase [Massilibacillus sp.]|nr:integral rane sensor signal transduction histidine kinase [Massilibacillus sp.]
MSRKVNHLKDELRRTFTLYALIPIFIISLISFALAFTYWNTSVLGRTQSKLAVVCDSLETLISGYMEKANEIASFSDLSKLQENQASKVEMYQKLYEYTNQTGVYTDFYIFDEQMNMLISSKSQEPEFARIAKTTTWGIIRQIKDKPAVPVFSFIGNAKRFSQPMDIAVGKAVLEKGQIKGYVIFILSGAQILNGMSNPYVHIVVTDPYENTPICTDDIFCDPMNKIRPEFRDASGYFSFEGKKYYVNQKEILSGALTVYAFNAIGSMVTQFTNAVYILIGVLFVLTVMIVISVKKQAEEKTKMIDQLVDAFTAVKNGDLDKKVAINTNNEFEIIGESYNLMLSSLKELIHTNKEKARETVISEIKQLESQFNPHFLFNTLENIKFMTKLDPIKECIVPKLVIQPIIENAIKYGFKDCQHLMVEMEITFYEEQLSIVIYNNGAGIQEDTLTEIRQRLDSKTNRSEHSGLYNVNRRIHLMYGDLYGLEIMSKENEGTVVKIILPVHRKIESL